jgi:hypothetical protein
LAKQTSGTDLVSRTVDGVIQRADEITELLAYYQLANERTDQKTEQTFKTNSERSGKIIQ